MWDVYLPSHQPVAPPHQPQVLQDTPSPCRPPRAPATELLQLFKLPGVLAGLGLPGLQDLMELEAARPGQMPEMKASLLEMLPESPHHRVVKLGGAIPPPGLGRSCLPHQNG